MTDSNHHHIVNNVYELPSIKQIIHYQHATAGFPTKATWLIVIKVGFYAIWPMLTATAVTE